MTEKIKVTRNRIFSAHHMLIGAARAALQDAESKRPGYFYSRLTTITMSALALEALCNAFGEKLFSNWKNHEQLNPIDKLILITDKIGIALSFKVQPWSTARWLYNLRNKIAHAKPEISNETYIWTREEYEKRERDWPVSKLERQITLGNSRKSIKCIEDIKLLLFNNIKIRDKSGLYCDSWDGVAGIIKGDG